MLKAGPVEYSDPVTKLLLNLLPKIVIEFIYLLNTPAPNVAVLPVMDEFWILIF